MQTFHRAEFRAAAKANMAQSTSCASLSPRRHRMPPRANGKPPDKFRRSTAMGPHPGLSPLRFPFELGCRVGAPQTKKVRDRRADPASMRVASDRETMPMPDRGRSDNSLRTPGGPLSGSAPRGRLHRPQRTPYDWGSAERAGPMPGRPVKHSCANGRLPDRKAEADAGRSRPLPPSVR